MSDVPDWVDETLKHCPECGQTAKIYPRQVTGETVRALILMHKTPPNLEGYHYTPELLQRKQADEAKARYWGLIEAQPDRMRGDGSNRHGYWRLTHKGHEFVLGRVPIIQYALVYNGECIGFKGEDKYVEDRLGKKFNYRELMA